MRNTLKQEEKTALPPVFSGGLLRLFQSREFSLFLVIAFVFTVLAILRPADFLQWKNFEAITNGMVYDLAMAAGMTVVFILWGIDLSVGSVLALTSVIVAMLLRSGTPIGVAVLAGLAAAAACGAINGFLISRFRIAPFIVTLAMFSIARGTAVVLTSGYYLSGLPDAFLVIGRGKFLGLPISIIVVVILLVILGVLLKRSRFFNQMYFVGKNPEAAELSGMDVRSVLFAGYMISSLMAGIAAVIMTSRLAMGFSQFGLLAELRAIAATVIGGASFSGGSGSIPGAALGVILLALINNGFVMLNGSPDWQQALSGFILLVAVGVDAYRRRKERKEA
jgi:ribose/xylose/arabinose/galactoside ABC-type transport system permease subunit